MPSAPGRPSRASATKPRTSCARPTANRRPSTVSAGICGPTARETKAKGATPVVLSLIPRNIWKDGKIGRAEKDYGLWAKQAAEAEGALFIDFNGLLADRYEALGPEKTAALFCGTDHTHTGPDGAEFNAGALAEALRKLPGCDLGGMLLPDGLWLPSVFSDHMVLQREMSVPVWGTAAPGTEVGVKMGKHATTAKADAHGCWKSSLPAMPPADRLI